MGQIGAANSIGMTYELKLKEYPKAIEWYKKAYSQGDINGAYNLGYYYDVTKHDFPNAIIWYKKAAKKGNGKAINNLAIVYHKLKDNTKAAAYILVMANYGYSKKQVMSFLTKNWKIDKATIKKAYQLQKTLDIPKHYYDREFEETNSTSHATQHGRRR
jgi:TPR repeat protein